MARQDGIIPMNGVIGNLSFYKTRDGYFVRKKISISPARVKSDPAFARTRENAAEFAQAARAGKLLRTAFAPLLVRTADSRVTCRLAGALVQVIRADTAHPVGQRTIQARHTSLIDGFNFNRHALLHRTFDTIYTASIDWTTNSFAVDIPSFSVCEGVCSPPGATHLRLTACGVSVDFPHGRYERAITRSAIIPIDTTPEPLLLSGGIPGDRSRPVFLALCVEFLQEVNGKINPLQNQEYNAMAIVNVDGAISNFESRILNFES